LQEAEILVLLLPDTPQTLNIINSDTLSQMPNGCVIINPGRGSLIDDEALLDALLKGHVASACLDVFKTEPLPKDDAYWKIPNVTVTGHVASGTRADSASRVIVQNIARGEANLPFLYLVDRQAGY
jgi:glyoxylate/hydroxypyruvate reductase A